MKIVNENNTGDYHIHTITFSDGFNSIDEMVSKAGELGLKEIAVTDHCQALLDAYGISRKTHYDILFNGRWRNIHNNVNIIYGIEADLLNENGDICDNIQGFTQNFLILSAHKKVYRGDPALIKTGYLKAIERYGSRIKFLGHLCSKQFSEFLKPDDILEIVNYANGANVAVELNCANLVNNKTEESNLITMLSSCNLLYINSDAHTLYELINYREYGFNYLKQNNFL